MLIHTICKRYLTKDVHNNHICTLNVNIHIVFSVSRVENSLQVIEIGRKCCANDGVRSLPVVYESKF